MNDAVDDPTKPFTPNTPDPYENQLSQWAKAKISAGADPTVVNSLVSDKVHAYRASLGAKTDTPRGAETTGERAAGVISAAYQGATLGAGNKITAGIRTVLPEAIGGTKGFDFPQALKEQTQVLDDYRTRHPIEAGAFEVAGSLPTLAAGGAAKAVQGASGLRKVWQVAKTGAQVGAASGALSSNSLEDIAPNTLRGGAFGAVAAPIVGAAANPAVRAAANAFRRVPGLAGVGRSLARSVGAGPVTAEEKASGMIANSLDRGGVNPLQAAGSLVDAAPTTAMDLGSQPTLKVVRQARNVPTSTAGQKVDTFLSDRAAGAGKRIEGALTDATGHAPTDVDLPVEELIARRAQEAKPLYEEAYAHGHIQDPETVGQIKALLKNPTFAKAWQRGQNLVALEGETTAVPTQAIPKGIDPSVWETLSPKMKNQFVEAMTPTNKAAAAPDLLANLADDGVKPTVAQIDAWKKGLDAQIESSAGSDNALSRSEARVYRQKLNGILDRVDAEAPAYGKARASFRGNSELKDAAEQGADHFSTKYSADYLHRTLPDLSDGEQEAYRANALNAAVQKIRAIAANPDLPDAARGTNIVQRVMGTDDAGRKLRMLFPDEGAYNAFIQHMEHEAQFPKTNKFLTGQSSTAAQLAEGNTSPGLMRDAVMATHSPYAKLRLVGRGLNAIGMGGRGMSPAVADAVGDQAIRTGPALQDALRKMMTDKTAKDLARQRAMSMLGSVGASAPNVVAQP